MLDKCLQEGINGLGGRGRGNETVVGPEITCGDACQEEQAHPCKNPEDQLGFLLLNGGQHRLQHRSARRRE
jgi:hypothetical protein